MKYTLSLLLTAALGLGALPSTAKATTIVVSAGDSGYGHHRYYDHDRYYGHGRSYDRDRHYGHDRYYGHRRSHREYHRAHWEYRRGHRYYVPARTVVVYF